MEHELKCWPIPFQALCAGYKTFEIRYNDRDYKEGDTLHLREITDNGEHTVYTGKELRLDVTHIMHGPDFGLEKDWVIMSVKLQQ